MKMMENTIREIVEQDIRDGIIHGAAVCTGTSKKELYRECFGFAENSHQQPMRTDTVIDMASVTKAASTVTSLLICRDRGLIDFDAPFTDYLPDFKAKLRMPVRVCDLANHTSGFGDVPGQEQRLYFDESGTRMLQNMLTVPPPYPPGGKPQYACWNYILLAMIVERITGRKFDEFCRNEIFRPLEMNDSSLGKPVDVPPERLAQTFGTERPGQISDFVAYRIYRDDGTTGNAGMFSTARDIAKLLRCYLRHGEYGDGTGRLFSELSFDRIKPDRALKVDGYRRFGWIIYDGHMTDSEFGTSLLHSGWSGQTVFMNFEKDFFAFVLTPRCGDYERAKRNRFEIIRQLFEQA